jgi:hypothetical protein
MSWNFLGFFLEKSRITNEKILDYNVQSLDLLKGDHKCMLLLTDKCSSDVLNEMEEKNVKTFNLVNYYIN